MPVRSAWPRLREPLFAPTRGPQIGLDSDEQPAPSLNLPTGVDQNPSAMGVVRVSARLHTAPNAAFGGDRVLAVGTTVTVTGRGIDRDWLAVFLGDGEAGWLPTTALQLFGDDDLTIVDSAEGPGPIATLIYEALQPLPAVER